MNRASLLERFGCSCNIKMMDFDMFFQVPFLAEAPLTIFTYERFLALILFISFRLKTVNTIQPCEPRCDGQGFPE